MKGILIFHFICLFLVLFHVVGNEYFSFGFIPEIALVGNYLLTFSIVLLFLDSWKKDSWEQFYVRILKFFTAFCASGFLFLLITFPLVPVGILIVTYSLPQEKVAYRHYFIDTPTRVGMHGDCTPCNYYLHKIVAGVFDITTQEVDLCVKSADCLEPKSIKIDETTQKLYVRLETVEDSKFSEGIAKRDTTVIISLKY